MIDDVTSCMSQSHALAGLALRLTFASVADWFPTLLSLGSNWRLSVNVRASPSTHNHTTLPSPAISLISPSLFDHLDICVSSSFTISEIQHQSFSMPERPTAAPKAYPGTTMLSHFGRPPPDPQLSPMSQKLKLPRAFMRAPAYTAKARGRFSWLRFSKEIGETTSLPTFPSPPPHLHFQTLPT